MARGPKDKGWLVAGLSEGVGKVWGEKPKALPIQNGTRTCRG